MVLLCVLENTINMCNLWQLMECFLGSGTLPLLLGMGLWVCSTIMEFYVIVL